MIDIKFLENSEDRSKFEIWAEGLDWGDEPEGYQIINEVYPERSLKLLIQFKNNCL